MPPNKMYISTVNHIGCTTRFLLVEPLNFKSKCPDCQAKIEKNEKWTISRLPCPLAQSHEDLACGIVIKPSNGHFKSYKLGDDLHIGISNSQGLIYSFWTKGIEIDTSKWENSLKILDFRAFFFENLNLLDNSMDFFVEIQRKMKKFDKSKYMENDWNCFDFVMEYMKFTNYRNYRSKIDFLEEFVTKKLENVVKYCMLFEKLSNK
ncbi:MKRN2 opposite strand protein-like C-terminal domain-containing protein [Caenorhabditis elegans]|uniref:MKRN2 opposite strand protein-like C-terminal domain-containing protein n=3 Tax=Caenorhabditis elegans TaxID=6239 RepID=A0A8D9I6V4_CAEEL|nr:PIR Superfamily Protein [Caenorhabditis elegans]CAG8860246.1 PIR Superfamily Protein [Caenorhabditis elegans]